MAKVGPAEADHNLDQQSKSKEKNDEASWIKNEISMRKCSCYVPSENEDICQCGYGILEHIQSPSSPQKQEVESPSTKLERDSSEPTYTFGEIEFDCFGGNIGKFVRVDRKIKMDTILELMKNVWGMEKPNLLISVTGGSDNCNIKPHLKDVFQRDLMKAANSTGAWIITGGTHTGVTKLVGEAVKNYGLTSANQKPVVAISIAPWGVIHDLENKEGSWPVKDHIEKDQNPKESFLDPNHSHFILVDDGTQHNYATEITFRAELERKISEMQTDTRDDQISLGSVVSVVPTVMLVLEGGPSALETVQNALFENTPAVIIKGSGRAADILAFAFKYAETVEVDTKDKWGVNIKIIQKHTFPTLEAEICKQMKKVKFCPEQEIDVNIQRIKNCLFKPNLIHIFKWNSSTGTQDLDTAMLKALLKANKNSVMDQLGLALAWNRIDIVKNEIFADDKRWPTGSLDNIMLLAIKMNRANFVELFLDRVVSLKKFLTSKRLLLLYNQVSSRSLLQFLFNKMWRIKEVSFTSLLKSLCNTIRCKKKKECNKTITLKDVRELIQDLLGYDLHCIPSKKHPNINGNKYPDSNQDDKAEEQFDNPEWELFIWSVLNTQQEMAELFWLHGKDAIAAALVAHALFTAMSHRTYDTELNEQLEANAAKFTQLAIGVMKETYRTDEKKAHDLLIRKVSQCEKSCILIAAEAENKEFLSQTECQGLLKSIWKGKMTKENGTLRVAICALIPLLIPLLVKYKEKDDHETHSKVQAEEKSKQRPPSINTNTSQPSQQAQGRNIVNKVSNFYQAPVTIFCQNVIVYMAFLCLYSYILICKFEENLSVEEILQIVWVFAIMIEEGIQVWKSPSVKSYFTDGWNIIDVIAVVLFVIGTILRSISHPQTLEAARVFLGVDLVAFYIRLLHIFCVHRRIGPKLLMIIHTFKSLIYFFVILLVFVVAYAIASHAILYPNTELSIDSLIAIFRRPYWNIYGELMLDEVEGVEECTNDAELYRNGTYSRCPTVSGKYFGPVLMGVYMLMTNILLLNLLIVMFSDTYKMVEDNINMYWNLQLLNLIDEYWYRSNLPPPFSLIVHVFQFMSFICTRYSQPHNSTPERSAFLKTDCTNELCQCTDKLRQWEDDIADTFHRKRNLGDQDSMYYRVQSTALQDNQLVKKIDKLKIQALTETIVDVQSSSSQNDSTNSRLENIEKQLQWIIKSLSKHGLGVEEEIPKIDLHT